MKEQGLKAGAVLPGLKATNIAPTTEGNIG